MLKLEIINFKYFPLKIADVIITEPYQQLAFFTIIKCTYKYSRKRDTFGRPFRFTKRFNQQWIATSNTDPFGQVSADTKIHGAKSAKVGKENSALYIQCSAVQKYHSTML